MDPPIVDQAYWFVDSFKPQNKLRLLKKYLHDKVNPQAGSGL